MSPGVRIAQMARSTIWTTHFVYQNCLMIWPLGVLCTWLGSWDYSGNRKVSLVIHVTFFTLVGPCRSTFSLQVNFLVYLFYSVPIPSFKGTGLVVYAILTHTTQYGRVWQGMWEIFVSFLDLDFAPLLLHLVLVSGMSTMHACNACIIYLHCIYLCALRIPWGFGKGFSSLQTIQ